MLNDYQSKAPGTSLNSWSPGFLMYGLLINNPSGSWLQVKTSSAIGFTFVPPYTLGWRRNLIPASQVLDILAVGPTGTPSSTAGQNWEAMAYDTPFPNESDGFTYSVIGNPTPVTVSGTHLVDGVTFTVASATAGMRYRIYTAIFSISILSSYTPTGTTEMLCTVNISNGLAFAGVSSISSSVPLLWPLGLDGNVGAAIQLNFAPLFPNPALPLVSSGTLNYTIQYALI